MKKNEPSYLSYISYVTLREAWDICGTRFFVWLVLSAFFLAAGWLGMLGAGAAKSWGGEDVPNWVWWCAFWCVLSWFMRGEEIKIHFPKMNFGPWLLYSCGVFLIAWMFTVLPWWASSPVWLALFVVAGALDNLVAQGKENLAKMNASAGDETKAHAWER